MLSMKAKYALKALVLMAKNDGEQMHVKGIAEQENIPYKFLEAIFSELKRHGIVNSRRGASGGYVLAKDARKIMAGDVIRLIDGPLAPIRCASLTAYQPCEDCPDEEQCALHDVMLEVRSALSSVLDSRSIFELSQYKQRKRRRSGNHV